MQRMRVLIVDDSAVVRKLLGDALRNEPDIEVIGGAGDPFVAREMILQYHPDVITLDIEMPRMDGLTFLSRLMEHHPIPAIIISSLTQSGSSTSIEALRIGAIDVISKPGGPQSVGQVADRVIRRIRALRDGPPVKWPSTKPAPSIVAASAVAGLQRARGLIVVGASTGGPQAIETLLSRMPADSPPILVVQHMPAGFTRAFATRLDSTCPLRVVEAAAGARVERGTAYVAPGDYHMNVDRQGIHLAIRLHQGAPVQYQRPAVDELFRSVARLGGTPTVGVLLTGMGDDGAAGMVALRAAGAETIAEAEESCVVFGMPKSAIECGGATHVASLLQMPALIAECLARSNRARVA